MIGLQKLLVYSTLLLSTYASPRHHHDDEITNWEKFSALLDGVDEGALHRVLHALSPKFKDGIFSRDRTAIEHVHSENPVMASKLVHIAKRQGSNSTVTTTTSSATTPEESSSAEQSSSVAASVSSAISSALSSEITATTLPSPTSVLVAPTSPESATPISTGSGAVVYSTVGGGVVTLTSSAVSVRFTPSTSTHLYYTTLPDGSVSTKTSLFVVNAPQTETASDTGSAGAAATTSSAGLQSGADRVLAGGLTAILAGALGLLAYL